MMSRIIKLPQSASYLFPWILTFIFAGLAWIVTYQQVGAMGSGTMGMSSGTMGMPSRTMGMPSGMISMPLGPFLLFWTIMMVAMMFPALAPMVSIQYGRLRQQSLSSLSQGVYLGVFLLGYVFGWFCVGLPIFFLSLLTNQLLSHAPSLGLGLGILIFVFAGVYQIIPFQRRCTKHCTPFHLAEDIHAPSLFSNLKEGVLQTLFCLGCCANLMIVLIAVGLMNLFWMVLITLIIFIQLVWSRGYRLSPYIGVLLIAYGLLSFLKPMLFLPGLSM